MRTTVAVFLSAMLLASNAVAAESSVTPLPGGQPAGTRQAALLGPSAFLLFISAGVLVGGIALAVSNNNKKGVTSATTTATSTLP